MKNIVPSKVISFFLAIIVFIAVTADRNLLISYFISYRSNVVITLVFVLVIFFRYLSESIIRGSIKYNRYIKNVLVVLVISSIYFLIHSIMYPTSFIPVKYSILSVLIIVFITKKIDITSIINGFAIIGLFLSIAIIFQQFLLMLFHGGSLSGFDILISGKTDFLSARRTSGFVAPYGLGLIEYYNVPFIYFNGFEYFRPSIFTHEPKHASSILLLTLSTVLLSNFSLTIKKMIIGIHLIAIFLIMAITSYLVLIITLGMYFIYKKKLFPIYYVPTVIVIPFILPWILEYTLTLFPSENGLIYFRLLSASAISGTKIDLVPSLFGIGAHSFNKDSDSLLYYIYGQYGIIALVIVALLLFVLIKQINNRANIAHFSSMNNFGLILLVNIFVFYNLYVFSDFLNLFSAAIILLVLFIIFREQYTLFNNRIKKYEIIS